MKKPAAFGLALAVAAGMALAMGGIASANPPPPPKHHPHSNFSFGFSIGPGFFWPYQPYYYQPPPPVYLAPGPYATSRWDLHVQWCLAHYRTYNPGTNTYFWKVGVPAVCVSPYSY